MKNYGPGRRELKERALIFSNYSSETASHTARSIRGKRNRLKCTMISMIFRRILPIIRQAIKNFMKGDAVEA